MKKSDTIRVVHEFLCKNIAIESVDELPVRLYGFDASTELLFTFRLFGHGSVGASEYVAVSQVTGAVRYLGFLGE